VDLDMSKNHIVVRNLYKNFSMSNGEVKVLKNVSFEIDKGDMTAVVGESGAGKSTLLHIVGTLDRPTSGEVWIDGENIFKRNDASISRFRNTNIGFVFQMHHLLPEFSALENVMMPGLIAGMSRSKLAKEARILLDLTGVSHRVEHRSGELSGGEQQRVALARSLILKPEVVLADEPTGNLDTSTGSLIHDLMFNINKELNTTFMVVTHNVVLAKKFPNVISLQDGKIL